MSALEMLVCELLVVATKQAVSAGRVSSYGQPVPFGAALRFVSLVRDRRVAQ